MRLLYIFLIIILLLIIYLLYLYFTQKPPLTTTHNAKTTIVIDPAKMENNNSSNFTYSVWFNVSNWNYRYGEEKVIFQRMNSEGDKAIGASFNALQNNIDIDILTYPTTSTSASASNGTNMFTCGIDNVPIQRWVNVLVSVYGKSMDVYLDGKLVRTCVLPGLAKVDSKENVTLTPSGGFDGYTSKFEYFNVPTNPQQAWNIYKQGFGGGLVGSLFNKYRIKISFLDNNKSVSSYEL